MVTIESMTEKEIRFSSSFSLELQNSSFIDFQKQFSDLLLKEIKNNNPSCKDELFLHINSPSALVEFMTIYLQEFLRVAYYEDRKYVTSVLSLSFRKWYEGKFTKEERIPLEVDNRELLNKIHTIVRNHFDKNFEEEGNTRFKEVFFERTVTKGSGYNRSTKFENCKQGKPEFKIKNTREEVIKGMPSYWEDGWLNFPEFKKKYDYFLHQDVNSFTCRFVVNGNNNVKFEFNYEVNKQTYEMKEIIDKAFPDKSKTTLTYKEISSSIKEELLEMNVFSGETAKVIKNSNIF